MEISTPSVDLPAGGHHDRSDNHVHPGVDRLLRKPGKKEEVGDLGAQSPLQGEGQGEIEPGPETLLAGGISDGVTEGDRPGMFVGKDAMQKAVAEGLKKKGKHSHPALRK